MMGTEKQIGDRPELRVTDDSSHTLYIPSIDEHYHSHYGALTESRHIFINAGLNYCHGKSIKILEVGFGTGLNALLTAMFAEEREKEVSYVTLEKYPLDSELIGALNYGKMTGERGSELFGAIHDAEWNIPVTISRWFTIHKKMFDLTAESPDGFFDLVYFDAFGPDKQPEMWTPEIISKINAVTQKGSVFVTYSAKGSLKRMLRELGFEVSLLPGPPGKRVTTRAEKK